MTTFDDAPLDSSSAYYATAVFSSTRWVVLAGPFDAHSDAEARVEDARRAAMRRAQGTRMQMDFTFAEYGTAHLHSKPGRALPTGWLNAELGVHADA